jgi:RNA recognition motif-containing protein
MNIYVAKFDNQVTDEQLKNLFIPFGEVKSARVQMDNFTDKSRCFGYVEMPDEQQARNAIGALNQSDVNGCQIKVEESEVRDVKRGSYKVGNAGINPYQFKKN